VFRCGRRGSNNGCIFLCVKGNTVTLNTQSNISSFNSQSNSDETEDHKYAKSYPIQKPMRDMAFSDLL